MSPLRLAVIGMGSMGQKHVQALSTTPGIELSATVDPIITPGVAVTGAPVPHYKTLETLLSDNQPDGVILATPNQLHGPQARQLIGAGLPVLIEKPISDLVENGQEIVRLSEHQHVPVLVGHHRRYNGQMQAAKAALEGGLIGPIVTVTGSWVTHKPDDYYDIPWRREAGGGPILINLIHDVDCLRYLLGDIIAVQAMISNQQRGFEVEDSACVLLKFESGILATLTLSDAALSPWSWEHSAQEPNARAYPQMGQDCYFLAGRDGALAIPSLKYWQSTGGRDWQAALECEVLPSNTVDPFPAQIKHFADVIRGETSPIITARDALETLKVIEAIREAAAAKSEVRL